MTLDSESRSKLWLFTQVLMLIAAACYFVAWGLAGGYFPLGAGVAALFAAAGAWNCRRTIAAGE